MRVQLLILALAATVAYGQQVSVVGIIDWFAGNEIRVRNQKKTITVLIDDHTVGASKLKHGDEISVRADLNGSGKLLASRIWSKVVTPPRRPSGAWNATKSKC